MLRNGYGALAVGLVGIAAVGLGGDAGCSATKPTELVPGATTQVQVPRDLGGLRVIVLGNGQKVFDTPYSVINGIATLPATLGVVARGSPSTVVTIAIFGFKQAVVENNVVVNGQRVDCSTMSWDNNTQDPQPIGSACGPSVERGSTQTYVDQRILFLPLPLSYSCWGNDDCTGTSAPGTASQTCKGAQCLTNVVDPHTLVDFDPALLDGTQDCFSPSLCFPPNETVSAVAVDPTNCTYTFPAKPARPGLNVRIFYEDLKYDTSQNPPKLLSQAPSAEEEVLNLDATEGFSVPDAKAPQVFKLAPGLCSLVQAGLDPANAPANPKVKIPHSGILHAVTDVQVSSACQSKVQLLPFCANEQNPQSHTVDGGPSPVTCNTPIVLQPAPSAVYLVMDNSAVMNGAFGTQGYATAMSLSLADPIFKRTYVAFQFLDHALSDCTNATTPYTTPTIDFGLANVVQPQIAMQLLNVMPPDTKSMPAPLNIQTALRLDQGAFKALQTLQKNINESLDIGAVMLFVNRIPDSTGGGSDGGSPNPFPGADCSPALGSAPDAKTAIEQEIQAATAAGLHTYFVVLNDDSMLGSQVLPFYQQIASDLTAKGVGSGVTVLDATPPMMMGGGVPQQVIAKFSQTVTQLGTCLYELPPGIDTTAALTFTIPVPIPPIASKAPVPVSIPLAANCNAANQQTASGWNVEGSHIRVCGAFCNEIQQTVEAVAAATLASSPDGGLANIPEVPVAAKMPCADGGT
jgi:hypothetical protein